VGGKDGDSVSIALGTLVGTACGEDVDGAVEGEEVGNTDGCTCTEVSSVRRKGTAGLPSIALAVNVVVS
jgi:hypothetical protein